MIVETLARLGGSLPVNLPLADKTTTIWIILGLVLALAVIGLVIYISYRSTLDDDSRGTDP